ncbi:hypothetical protein EW35_1395 [Staphylococcus aureus]|nr:hypothetical protein EW35_1395 [Staphylococcus aureus]
MIANIKIKEINDKSVTYKYFPNNDENIKLVLFKWI